MSTANIQVVPSTREPNDRPDPRVLSYMSVRRWMGWLGIAMPFALAAGLAVLGCDEVMQPSISHYFYSI